MMYLIKIQEVTCLSRDRREQQVSWSGWKSCLLGSEICEICQNNATEEVLILYTMHNMVHG